MINLQTIRMGKQWFVRLNHEYTKADVYLVNGTPVVNTFHRKWFQCDGKPKSLWTKESEKRVNYRYELKDASLASDERPAVVTPEEIDTNSGYHPEWFDAIRPLYAYKHDTETVPSERIDCEITTIHEMDEEIINTITYQIHGEVPRSQTIHKIILPELALGNRACSLDSEQSYRIIRAYVKENIVTSRAIITSDYNFCFTVERRIPLLKNYTVKRVTILEIAPKHYQNYPIVEPFIGKNIEDLRQVVSNYLAELMAEINQPFVECACCGGTGTVEAA